jgi:hypothetical protein
MCWHRRAGADIAVPNVLHFADSWMLRLLETPGS